MLTIELFSQGLQIMRWAGIAFVATNLLFLFFKLGLKQILNKQYGKKKRR